jgi:hypothetical protein
VRGGALAYGTFSGFEHTRPRVHRDLPGGRMEIDMGKKTRTGVLKRQREAKKAEKAALKREKREVRHAGGSGGVQVATANDLAGYGFLPPDRDRES